MFLLYNKLLDFIFNFFFLNKFYILFFISKNLDGILNNKIKLYEWPF